jgi:rRNA processing protein Gar1
MVKDGIDCQEGSRSKTIGRAESPYRFQETDDHQGECDFHRSKSLIKKKKKKKKKKRKKKKKKKKFL